MTDMNTTTKPGVLAVMDEIRVIARPMMTASDQAEFAEARATVERLAGDAQRLCDSMLPTLVKQSKTNPNAGFIDWRDWVALYAEVNALRQQLAAFRGDV